MKKIFAFLGALTVFVIVGAVLENLLGISFPSLAAEATYDVFTVLTGSLVLYVAQHEF